MKKLTLATLILITLVCSAYAVEVEIPDPNLERVIREELNKPDGPITDTDLESITELNAYNEDIADLTGLEYCTNLTDLSLWENPITDISPLSNLTNLTAFSLGGTPITDISPLSNLTNLTKLSLWGNQISDISVLSNLTNLTRLYLSGNQIVDISPLSNLTNLTVLGLQANQISNISSLANLTNLTVLHLASNQISNLQPLVDNPGIDSGDEVDVRSNPLKSTAINTQIPALQARGVTVIVDDVEVDIPDANLERVIREIIRAILNKPDGPITDTNLRSITELSADSEDIVDLTGLGYCTNLTELYLDHNQITDISPLSNLTNLTGLRLDNNQISDISALSNLTNLTGLRVYNNQITDISPLSNLTNLTELYLDDNQISDINPLNSLINLQELSLYHNRIRDVSLSNLANLQVLELYSSGISKISLSNLTSLQKLRLMNNQISDINLSNLPALQYLNLNHNQINNLTPLSKLTSLQTLSLRGNKISDIGPLSRFTNLQDLNLIDNQINDILPLVENEGLDLGDYVALGQNPLNHTSKYSYIQQLFNRRVDVGHPYRPILSVIGQSEVSLNEIFTLDVQIKGVINLEAFQLDVPFTRELEFQEAIEGPFLSHDGADTFWAVKEKTNRYGSKSVNLSATRLQKQGISGKGVLAKIKFKAIDAGNASVEINIKLVDSNNDEIKPVDRSLRYEFKILNPAAVCDIDKNGIIDVFDFALVGTHFGEEIPPDTEPNPDVNRDGVVNIFDLVLVGKHFGEKAAPSIKNISLLQQIYDMLKTLPNPNDNLKLALRELEKLLAPKETVLMQNYPNPFNPETWIPFQLSDDAKVIVSIYDVEGQLVRKIGLGEVPAGVYVSKDKAIYWDGRNSSGEQISSGLYFYTLQARSYSATKRMLILK